MSNERDASPQTPPPAPVGPPADTGPILPPPDTEPTRILSLSGRGASTTADATLRRLLEVHEPDVVVGIPPRPNTVSTSLRRVRSIPTMNPMRGVRARSLTPTNSSCVVALPAQDSDIDPSQHPVDTATCPVFVGSTLSLDIDPYERETRLEGVTPYVKSLPKMWGDGVHLSTSLRAGYRTQIVLDETPVPVVGIGRTTAQLGVGVDNQETTAAVVDVFPNGAVRTESIDPSSYGLTAITGVGPSRASTLREQGCRTPDDVADTPVRELADYATFGHTVAEKIHAAATAVTERTIVPTGDDSLPHNDPVFIDIETDGLEPSVAWLIGVLDGDASTGRYMPFTESEPGDTGHLEAFLTWLDANAADRPLVAWNGYGFDFPVLRDQIRQHCPEYLDLWDSVYQFDALYWARDKNGGNAVLPGRDNTLETVAEALGWEPTATGVTGQTVAEMYVVYREAVAAAETPASVSEPDWERLERYCEDDVRALATIYDALDDAARMDSHTTSNSPTGSESVQGALSDFN